MIVVRTLVALPILILLLLAQACSYVRLDRASYVLAWCAFNMMPRAYFQDMLLTVPANQVGQGVQAYLRGMRADEENT